jgi:hypothetical protein
MGAYDHVLVLLSFVYALALTHLLSRVGAMVIARDRVRFSALLSLAIGNAVLFVFANWLSLWDLRGMSEWDLFSVTTQFVFAIGIYFLCALAAPEAGGENVIDMEAFYWRNRRYYYGCLFLCVLLSLVVNAEFLKTPNPALFLQENAMVLPMVPVAAGPLFVPSRWAQWLGGLGFTLLLMLYTILFSSTLH